MFQADLLSVIRNLVLYTQQNLYDIYLLLCMQYKTPDNGQKICPKRIEFYSKNKFEKLVYFIGFILRILNHHAICHSSMIRCSQFINKSHSQYMHSHSGMALQCETMKSNNVDESLMQLTDAK